MPKVEPKKTIAVDIDDVIYPLVPSLIKYLDTEHQVRFTEGDFVAYDLRKIWGGGPHEAATIYEKYKKDASFSVAPIKGAEKALRQLAKKYTVIVMTSRDVSTHGLTHKWLNTHFPEVFKEVHLLGNKQDSKTFREKAEVCKELGVFCLIDDNLRHITETAEAGIKTILFGNYPWNQTDKLPPGSKRLVSWEQIVEELNAAG